MEASDWIALAFGGIGLVTGALALILTYKSYRTNQRMAVANETMADANRRMVAANEEMVVASRLSAQAAREAADTQITAERAKKKGIIRLVTSDRGAIDYSRSGETGELVLYLRNEGQATAYDVRVVGTLEIPGRTVEPVTLGSTGTLTIEPGEKEECVVPITQHLYGDYPEREVVFRVSFRDGWGTDEAAFRVRIHNYWTQDWSSELLGFEPAR